MRVRSLVRADVGAVGTRESIGVAARVMAAVGVQVVAVVDEGGRLVGAVSAPGLAAALCGGRCTPYTAVERLVDATPPTARLDELVTTALTRMLDHGCAQLLCVDEEGRYAGLVRLSDLTARRSPRSAVASTPAAAPRIAAAR